MTKEGVGNFALFPPSRVPDARKNFPLWPVAGAGLQYEGKNGRIIAEKRKRGRGVCEQIADSRKGGARQRGRLGQEGLKS